MLVAAALQDKENMPVGNTILDFNNSNNATINTSGIGKQPHQFLQLISLICLHILII